MFREHLTYGKTLERYVLALLHVENIAYLILNDNFHFYGHNVMFIELLSYFVASSLY